MVNRLFLPLLSLSVVSCNQLDLKGLLIPTGEGVEKRFEQSAEMNENLKVASIQEQENYTFYVATDPHVYETHRNLDVFNDDFRNDNEASFAVILGDCIDVKDNLPEYMKALAYNPDKHGADKDIFHVLGNHDIFFNGWVDFKEMIGPSVYWFEVDFAEGKDLFISLDTATGTLGGRQTKWFRNFLKENRNKYRHCVILTHTNFFYTDTSQVSSGNMPLEESYALIDFLGNQNVSLVLQGHDHYREDLTYDGVRYTILGAIKDGIENPEYLKIHVTHDDLKLDWQPIF